MADYGITHFVDCNEFYIRQSYCSTIVRFREKRDRCPRCGRSETWWVVEIIADSDDEEGSEVFAFSNEEEAEQAAGALACFIDNYGERRNKEAES